MNRAESFNVLDGRMFRIPYGAVDLVIFNAHLSSESFEFAHMHHCYELYMVIDGSFKLQIEGREYVMEQGNICWIGPGVEHLDIYKDSPHHTLFIVTFDLVSSALNPRKSDGIDEQELRMLIEHANTHRHWVGHDVRSCRVIFDALHDELARCEVGSYLIISNLLSTLIIRTIQCMQLTPAGYQHPLKSAHNDNRARQITLYLDQHYSEDITLQQAADHLNITPRHINRILNEHYNLTFSKMLLVTRLAYAKLHMLNSNHSNEKIAELVGFPSVRALYKVFQEIEGMTISEYRKRSKPSH